ncbi:uncharacterized protein SETTUDRAFT_35851 [Exserohilum turcica Et28A]|uniref:Uncharacterized protein n=1 Tax=Exserohilum turcicum (strain 28A) TaxID=671987 RepID=R0I5P8_EXST2|nr:uncharacterized protein SETTUDRAFT_35851 [Exserohilum turcica Et28A]EOA80960.1 hypothetical protein SETTUDRAFT_35851 [Exserohilum turcica Et28A]
MDDIIFVGATPKQQTPKRKVDSPGKPALARAAPAQACVLTPSVVERHNELAEVVQHCSPSKNPPSEEEEEAFMLATRHALEQALGKQTLEQHGALLKQEKKCTEDYIAQLEEAVNQKTGIDSPMQNALVQGELAMWKARASGQDEATKTEMRLLRKWNDQLQQEKDGLEASVEEMKKENRALKAEVEMLKSAKRQMNGSEVKILRTRNVQLEEEKIQLESSMQLLKDECSSLKTRLSSSITTTTTTTTKHNNNSSSSSTEAKKTNQVDDHDADATNTPSSSSSTDIKQAKKRARDLKRRNMALHKENAALADKLGMLEMQLQDQTAICAQQLREEAAEKEDALADKEVQIAELQKRVEVLEMEVEMVQRSRHGGSVELGTQEAS